MIFIVFVAMIIYPFQLVEPLEYSVLYPKIFTGFVKVPLLSKIVGLLIILITAFFVNVLMRYFKLWSRMNYLPMLLYLLFYCIFPNLIGINPLTIANLFILTGFYFLFQVNEVKFIYSTVFSSVFLFSLASLFYLPFFAFLILMPLAFISFRIFRFRELMISVIAFATPWLFVAVFYYLNDSLFTHYFEFKEILINYNLPEFKVFTFRDIVLAALFFIVSAFISLRVLVQSYEQLIQIRLLSSFMVVYLIFSIITIGLASSFFTIHPSMMIFPMTVIFSLFLKNIKDNFIIDIVLVLIVIAIYLNAILNF